MIPESDYFIRRFVGGSPPRNGGELEESGVLPMELVESVMEEVETTEDTCPQRYVALDDVCKLRWFLACCSVASMTDWRDD